MSNPVWLVLPGIAAVMYVVAALLIKRSIEDRAGQRAVNVVANVGAAVLYQPLWFFADNLDWHLWWMPVLSGLTFLLGQIFTFRALSHGDVSVATPLLGMKVLFIAIVSTVAFGEVLSIKWWVGAAASSLGVVLVTGATPRSLAGRLLQPDALMSLAAAASFAVTDVLVQEWAPRFGTAGYIPVMFIVTGISTLILAGRPGVREVLTLQRSAMIVLIAGSVILGLQALMMAFSLSNSGNATAVNIVYASRSIWSVLLAWAAGRYFDVHAISRSGGTMKDRLIGSILLFAAVVLVLI